MLPVALKVNRRVRQTSLAWLAHELFPGTAGPEQAVDALIAEISAICDRVGVPRRLSQVGVTREQIPVIARDSRGSSMSGNPRELTNEELVEILLGIF